MKTLIYLTFCISLSVLALAFVFMVIAPFVGIAQFAAIHTFLWAGFVTFPFLMASVSSERVDVWEMFAEDTL